jgi:hypothetical protein
LKHGDKRGPFMPMQNRVTPEGEIVAVAARGEMFGNRGGCFHRDDGSLRPRPWANRQWLCCVLDFKERRRTLRQPGRYTELFFLDEATALSAGHRPCFECRRTDAVRFAQLWARAQGLSEPPSAPEMDLVLHEERLRADFSKQTFEAPIGELATGTMVRVAGAPFLVESGRLRRWSFEGYGPPVSKPAEASVEVLTPLTIVAILRAGYLPMLHATAR